MGRYNYQLKKNDQSSRTIYIYLSFRVNDIKVHRSIKCNKNITKLTLISVKIYFIHQINEGIHFSPIKTRLFLIS